VLSGGTTSCQEYHRIRMTTLYEPKTASQSASDRSKQLFTLPGALELQQQVFTAICNSGGGWKIG